MDELLGPQLADRRDPGRHHHVLLDQPLALVAALRAILADWEHSVPKKRPPDADGPPETRQG